MHKFSPWTEEELTVVSTVLLIIGVIAFVIAFAAAFQSSAHFG